LIPSQEKNLPGKSHPCSMDCQIPENLKQQPEHGNHQHRRRPSELH
jgi:hypothetical protein